MAWSFGCLWIARTHSDCQWMRNAKVTSVVWWFGLGPTWRCPFFDFIGAKKTIHTAESAFKIALAYIQPQKNSGTIYLSTNSYVYSQSIAPISRIIIWSQHPSKLYIYLDLSIELHHRTPGVPIPKHLPRWWRSRAPPASSPRCVSRSSSARCSAAAWPPWIWWCLGGDEKGRPPEIRCVKFGQHIATWNEGKGTSLKFLVVNESLSHFYVFWWLRSLCGCKL